MPFTPAHIGPVILIGSIAGRKLNLPVMVAAVVLIDLEVVYLGLRTNASAFIYHGFYHTLAGSIIYSFFLSLVIFSIVLVSIFIGDQRYKGFPEYREIRFMRTHDWQWSFKCIFLSAIVGSFAHISMDWLFYNDIRNLAVLDFNIYQAFNEDYLTVTATYIFCIIGFITGGLLYLWRYRNNRLKGYTISSIFSLKPKIHYLWVIILLLSIPFTLAGIITIIVFLSLPLASTSIFTDYSSTMGQVGGHFIFGIVSLVITFVSMNKLLKINGWKLIE
jgi:hypothetical protein